MREKLEDILENIAGSIDVFFVTGFLFGFALCAGMAGLYYDYSAIPSLKQQLSEAEAKIERLQIIDELRMIAGNYGSTFNYGDYKGHPVQLFVDDHGGATLQVIYGPREFPGVGLSENDLEYLKAQVELAVISSDGISMSNGMKLRVEGYPIWGPTTLMAGDRSARSLHFGDIQTFNNRTVVVRGSGTKPVGFYPYTFPVR